MSEVPPLLKPLQYLKETWEDLPPIAIWSIRIGLCLLFVIPWLLPPGLEEQAPGGGATLSGPTVTGQALNAAEAMPQSPRRELPEPGHKGAMSAAQGPAAQGSAAQGSAAQDRALESDRRIQHIQVRPAAAHLPRAESARSWTATLVPHTWQRISVRISGRVKDFPCKEGGVFAMGDPLFLLRDNRALLELERAGAQVQASQAQVKEAELACGNLRELLANEAATQREVRRAETILATARARWLEATIREKLALLDLESCRERAPFAGVVSRILFEKGEYVRKGEVLMEIFDPAQVQAVIRVKRQDLPLFRSDQKIRFVSDSGESQDGLVESIGVRQDPAAGTVRVSILLQNDAGRFWPGSSGRILLGGD